MFSDSNTSPSKKFQQSINRDELFKKRETTSLILRKQNRENHLMQKRQKILNKEMNAEKLKLNRDTLDEYFNSINSDNIDSILNGLLELKGFTTVDDDSIIRSNASMIIEYKSGKLVKRLLCLLENSINLKLVSITVCIIMNLVGGPTKDTVTLCELNVIPILSKLFMKLMRSGNIENVEIKTDVIGALYNICGDGKAFAIHVIRDKNCVLSEIHQNVCKWCRSDDIKINILGCESISLISNILRYKTLDNSEKLIQILLSYLDEAFKNVHQLSRMNNIQNMQDKIYYFNQSLHLISFTIKNQVEIIMESELFYNFFKQTLLLKELINTCFTIDDTNKANDQTTKMWLLDFFDHLLSSDTKWVNLLFYYDYMRLLSANIFSKNSKIRKIVIFSISNIACENTHYIDGILKYNNGKLYNIITNKAFNEISDVKEEILWIVMNIISQCNEAQLNHIINHKISAQYILSKAIHSQDDPLLHLMEFIVKSISHLLDKTKKLFNNDALKWEKFIINCEEVGMLDLLEDIQSWDVLPNDLCDIVVSIINTYFNDEISNMDDTKK